MEGFMNAARWIILLAAVIANFSCKKNEKIVTVDEQQVGSVNISYDQAPAGINRVTATMNRFRFESRAITLVIADSGSGASGRFNNVPIGLWHLIVEAYDDSGIVRYSGEAEVEVFPDQITMVDLTLLSNTGTVEVRVHWGNRCTPLPPGCVSWWSGDEHANDLVGGNNGTLVNGISFATGMVGQAFSFDGIDDRVAIRDTDNLRLTGSLTVESWILIRSFDSELGRIFYRGDDRYQYDPIGLYVHQTGVLAFTIQAENLMYTTLSTPVTTGHFLHVAATLDTAARQMKIYVNGGLAVQTFTTVRPLGDLDSTQNPGVAIGNTPRNSSYNNPFHGLIDEIAVYNRALNDREIRAIYLAGKAGKCR